MTTELKPCPFCGAEQGARTGGPKLMVSDSQQGWTVRCTGCLARGQNRFVQDDAVEAWNTRPQPIVTTDGLVERLNAMATEISNDWAADNQPVSQGGPRCDGDACTAMPVNTPAEALDRIASLERALTEARGAIASLPEDALGMVVVTPASFDDEGFEYPIRDELLSRIDTALSTTHPLNADEESK